MLRPPQNIIRSVRFSSTPFNSCLSFRSWLLHIRFSQLFPLPFHPYSPYVALRIWWPSVSMLGSGQTELLRNVPLFNGQPSEPQHGSISPSLTARGLWFFDEGTVGESGFQTSFPYNSHCLCCLHRCCGAVSQFNDVKHISGSRQLVETLLPLWLRAIQLN